MTDEEYIKLFKRQEDETMRGAIALTILLAVVVFIAVAVAGM